MNKSTHDHGKPIRYGNAFPWAGILSGVKRMMLYALLTVGLLLVLGIIGLAIVCLFADNEQVVDRF